MTEKTLVEGLKQQSSQAFEELVATYARQLYLVSLRILRNPQDAEDAVQETFLQVFQSIQKFREESSLFTWLYRIVSNKALEKLRKQGQREVVSIEPYLPHFESGQLVDQMRDWRGQLNLGLHTKELARFFEKCIDELPEEYRIPYILKDVEKLSEDQVCDILRLSKPTMKNRVHRARLVIRKRVEDRFFSSTRGALAQPNLE
ncbi:sigma-70 family RNA polymerase sigma factor [Acidobacteria bacterium AH-259-D05]|nr:sigma-70 family RNA polymerase sigma factor [Acidobacteria bacterium AH-259-D05]